MEKIAIIGLGLIGGSLGRALVQKGYEVTALDRDPKTLDWGLRLGAASRITQDPAEAVGEASVVFLAVPAGAVSSVLQSVVPFLRPGAVVSDMASVKTGVLEETQKLLPCGVEFVGGHPMAGTEQAGVAGADALLFVNAFYVLTPGSNCSQWGLETVLGLVRQIGAVPVIMDSVKHDRAVATLSHLPHLVAAALANAAGELEAEQPGSLNLAAGSFRDSTRVAESNPALWRDICLENRAMVLQAIRAFQQELAELEDAVRAGAGERIENSFSRAARVRSAYKKQVKGKLADLVEISLSVPNEPGVLGMVTKALGDGNINIANIEVLRAREGAPGSIILGFQGAEAASMAVEILAKLGIRVQEG